MVREEGGDTRWWVTSHVHSNDCIVSSMMDFIAVYSYLSCSSDYLPTVNAVPVPQPNHQYTTPPSTPLTSQSKPSPIEVNANHDFFLMLGRHPAIMAQCPKCSLTNIRTRVKTYPSLFSWLFTVAWFTVCMLGYFPFWWIIFAFFPFFYDGVS